MYMNKFLLTLITLLLAAPVAAKCTFINGGTTQTIYMSPEDSTIEVGVSSSSGGGLFITNSNIASKFNVSSSTPILQCDGNEDLLVGGSSLVLQDNSYFATNSKYYKLRHSVDGINYPNSGVVNDLVVKKGMNGDYSINDLFANRLVVGSRAIGAQFTYVDIEAYKAFTIYTSDGLELFHVYVNEYSVRRNAGCTLFNAMKTVNVDLGDTSYKGVNYEGVIGNEVPFNIKMVCHNADIYISINGETDDRHPSVLTNSKGDGYAENVGVQIKKDNNTLIPGVPYFLETRGIESWDGNFDLTYKFNAQVFSLAGKTRPGIIDIPGIFTIIYE